MHIVDLCQALRRTPQTFINRFLSLIACFFMENLQGIHRDRWFLFWRGSKIERLVDGRVWQTWFRPQLLHQKRLAFKSWVCFKILAQILRLSQERNFSGHTHFWLNFSGKIWERQKLRIWIFVSICILFVWTLHIPHLRTMDILYIWQLKFWFYTLSLVAFFLRKMA